MNGEYKHLRENLISWIDFSSYASCIEFNSKEGVYLPYLSSQFKKVKSVVFSEEDYDICIDTAKKYDNVDVIYADKKTGLCEKTERYDVIFLINQFFESVEQLENTLRDVKKGLADNGRAILCLDNKYGLRYWAGVREPRTQDFFGGIEGYLDYSGVIDFSKKTIDKVIEKVEFGSVKWYYPYPNKEYPMSIYSEEYMPKKGELNNNLLCHEPDNMILFDENKVFDSLIDDDMFELFANCFIVILEV